MRCEGNDGIGNLGIWEFGMELDGWKGAGDGTGKKAGGGQAVALVVASCVSTVCKYFVDVRLAWGTSLLEWTCSQWPGVLSGSEW